MSMSRTSPIEYLPAARSAIAGRILNFIGSEPKRATSSRWTAPVGSGVVTMTSSMPKFATIASEPDIG